LRHLSLTAQTWVAGDLHSKAALSDQRGLLVFVMIQTMRYG